MLDSRELISIINGVTTDSGIRLIDLAAALKFPQPSLDRWVRSGLVQASIAPPRGRRYTIILSRDDAIEAATLVYLRRAGITFQRLRRVVSILRSRGVKGAAFLALGATGKTVLMDGTGDWKDALSGQGYLTVVDLAAPRADVQRLLDEVEAERAKTPIVFKLPEDDGPIVHRRRRRKRPRMVAAHAIPKTRS